MNESGTEDGAREGLPSPDEARWGLVTLQALVDQSPYAPLEEPAEAVAERLLMVAHLTMNREVWSKNEARQARYWGAFTDAVRSSVLSGSVVSWWCMFMDTMDGVPLRGTGLLHEKNLLVRPALLDPPVADSRVLRVLDEWAPDLVDRTRMWVRERRQASAVAEEKQWDAAFGVGEEQA